MRSIERALGPVCLVIGATLLVETLATGGARLYLLVFIPVVTGTTPLFGISVVFIVAGFLLLPFLFVGDDAHAAPTAPPVSPSSNAPPSEGGSGGLILVGPIPIFFGAWRRNPPIPYRWALVLGVVLALVAVLLLWGLSVL